MRLVLSRILRWIQITGPQSLKKVWKRKMKMNTSAPKDWNPLCYIL